MSLSGTFNVFHTLISIKMLHLLLRRSPSPWSAALLLSPHQATATLLHHPSSSSEDTAPVVAATLLEDTPPVAATPQEDTLAAASAVAVTTLPSLLDTKAQKDIMLTHIYLKKSSILFWRTKFRTKLTLLLLLVMVVMVFLPITAPLLQSTVSHIIRKGSLVLNWATFNRASR